ncbi:unnamed protein product [Brassica oleracea]
MVYARVLETTRTAFYTGGSRKSSTTTSLRHDPKEGLSELHLATNSTCASGASFHRFPLSEFGLHLSSRSVRTSIECSGSELLLKKAQSSGMLSVSGRRSPSSSLCKRSSFLARRLLNPHPPDHHDLLSSTLRHRPLSRRRSAS